MHFFSLLTTNNQILEMLEPLKNCFANQSDLKMNLNFFVNESSIAFCCNLFKTTFESLIKVFNEGNTKETKVLKPLANWNY